MDELLLGIDVGTTAAKAALVGCDGRLHAVGRSEYPLHHVRAGWVEQDPEDLCTDFDEMADLAVS
jgi:xylulokinase